MASKSSRVWWARGRPVSPAGALRRRHGEGGRRVRRRAAHTQTLLQGRARAGYQGPYLLVALLLERGGASECTFGTRRTQITTGPRPDKVKPWSKTRVKILSSKRPDYYMIKYYTEVGKGGKPKGEAKHVAKTLYPIREPQGKVTAWGTAFRVYKPQTHYYLVFRAGWEQDEGSEKSYGRSVKLANLVTTHRS